VTDRYAAAVVFWRSDGSEVWHELIPAPFENRGFNEAMRYALRKPGDGWRLLVDDEPLNNGTDQSFWLWEPGFFAGQVTAELFRPEGTVASEFVLDVAPDPGKLGKDIFATMVDELWNEDPSLVIGSEPATNQIGDLGTLEDPWLAFARLRRYGPEFVRALIPIRARPHRTLRVRRDAAPLHHARRVDRQTATALLHSSAVAFFATGTEIAPVVSSDMRLNVPVIEETMDTTANRALLALTRGLLRRVTMVLDRLGGQVAREAASETRTPLAARWPARKRFLEELSLAARKALSSAPFSHARRAEITAAGLTVIAADPMYSRAWSRGWRAVRRGVDASPTAERLWLSPSWEIYERWCFVRLSQVLRSAAPDWNWQRRRNPAELIGVD
jgi:hypothetical protein